VTGALAVLGFVLAAFTPVPNHVAWRLAPAADVGPADAIVVLGASAYADGTLSDSSLRRAVAGIRLFRQGLAPRLLLLGVYVEADARAQLATELGVAPAAIVTERYQPTTRAEAAWAAEVLHAGTHAQKVLLVTDALHMHRARLLFERAGLTVRPAPTDAGVLGGTTPEARLRLTRVLAQEIVSLVYHRLFGYLSHMGDRDGPPNPPRAGRGMNPRPPRLPC
jgi:uncharacterized SAM-binding protein YcdF (DUF218 family)